MTENKENIDPNKLVETVDEPKRVYKTTEAQRLAVKRYKDKVKDTEEYKQKTKIWCKNYVENNREAFDAYHRQYNKTHYTKKREKDIEKYFPIIA